MEHCERGARKEESLYGGFRQRPFVRPCLLGAIADDVIVACTLDPRM